MGLFLEWVTYVLSIHFFCHYHNPIGQNQSSRCPRHPQFVILTPPTQLPSRTLCKALQTRQSGSFLCFTSSEIQRSIFKILQWSTKQISCPSTLRTESAAKCPEPYDTRGLQKSNTDSWGPRITGFSQTIPPKYWVGKSPPRIPFHACVPIIFRRLSTPAPGLSTSGELKSSSWALPEDSPSHRISAHSLDFGVGSRHFFRPQKLLTTLLTGSYCPFYRWGNKGRMTLS